MSLKRIAVLASGSGSNFQSLIDHIHGRYGEICLLASDNPQAKAIDRAAENGIKQLVIDFRALGPDAFFEELFRALKEEAPDLIVLAGFLKILPEYFYNEFGYRIINIHPALIPSFCGHGYYGIRVHEAVIASGAKITGVTVHFADGGTDSGPVILQRAVPVSDDDTPESLQKKVLETEHEILPEAVRLFLEDRLKVEGRKVYIL